jgi:hypothetical protein
MSEVITDGLAPNKVNLKVLANLSTGNIQTYIDSAFNPTGEERKYGLVVFKPDDNTVRIGGGRLDGKLNFDVIYNCSPEDRNKELSITISYCGKRISGDLPCIYVEEILKEKGYVDGKSKITIKESKDKTFKSIVEATLSTSLTVNGGKSIADAEKSDLKYFEKFDNIKNVFEEIEKKLVDA